MLTRYNYDDAYRLTAATRGMIAGQVDGDQDDHRHEDHHERSWSLGDKDRLQHPDWISSGWEHGWREPDGHDGRSDRAGKGGRDDHDQSSHWPSGPEDLGNYHYTYDAAGNLTAVKTPEGDWTGTVNPNNQYTTAQGNTWSYDAAGNVTDDGQRTYTWDAAHRLISITDKTTSHLSQFTYDGFSRLTVRKEYTSADATPTETHYLWCGDQICQTRDASDTITARYYSQGELQGNGALYYNTNHLGSVLGLLDAQGKSLGQTSYGPYGEPEQTQGKISDYRYAGMYYHASTGLYLTHYRFYDPQSGRWLNRDPIEGWGQSLCICRGRAKHTD
jgi:RHS repeat-associated protein